jgi:hypothetical protein
VFPNGCCQLAAVVPAQLAQASTATVQLLDSNSMNCPGVSTRITSFWESARRQPSFRKCDATDSGTWKLRLHRRPLRIPAYDGIPLEISGIQRNESHKMLQAVKVPGSPLDRGIQNHGRRMETGVQLWRATNGPNHKQNRKIRSIFGFRETADHLACGTKFVCFRQVKAGTEPGEPRGVSR